MNYRRKFGDMTGDAQLEKEEVTDAQISCLKAKLELGQAPFADMGVWGACGGRMHGESHEVHVTDAERQSLESLQSSCLVLRGRNVGAFSEQPTSS